MWGFCSSGLETPRLSGQRLRPMRYIISSVMLALSHEYKLNSIARLFRDGSFRKLSVNKYFFFTFYYNYYTYYACLRDTIRGILEGYFGETNCCSRSKFGQFITWNVKYIYCRIQKFKILKNTDIIWFPLLILNSKSYRWNRIIK